jgi:ribosomal protein S18 acetylase RimI-like enzyme
MLEIEPMTVDHASAVAKLHLNNLRTGYRGHSGSMLLRYYYMALVQSGGGSGYVAALDDCVKGYICGVWDRGIIKKALLKYYWANLAFWGGIQSIFNPRIFFSMVSNIGSKDHRPDSGYELRPIVVSQEMRGEGLASQLVNALLADAEKRQNKSIFLYTEEDNFMAIKFYTKFGFLLTSKHLAQKTMYLRFEYYL